MPASTLSVVPLVVQFLSPIGVDEADALLAACTLAHEQGTCTASPSAPEGALRATVEESSPDHVLLEVAGSGATGQLFASREVTFEPEDDPLERARSIGLTLGVLATSLLLSQSDPPAEEDEPTQESKPSPPKDEARTPQKPNPTPPFFFGVGGGLASTPRFSALGPSAGILARLRLKSVLAMDARVDGWATSLRSAPRLFALTPSLGLGAFVPAGTTLVGGGAYVGIEILGADVRAQNGETARAARTSALLGVMGTFGAPLFGPLWVFATPRAGFVLSPTELYLNEENVGKTGVVRLSLHLEFAFAPGQRKTVQEQE